MESYRRNAITVGVLYITGTVAGILSVALTGPVRNDLASLADLSTHANQATAGALCVLIMGLALAMVPVVMYPISRKHNQVLALGYVVFRGALETVVYIATTMSWLLLLALSQVYAQAGAPDAAYLRVWDTVLEAGAISSVGTIVFILGALMFYLVLYRAKLVPRWLSGWGLIATIPYLAAGLLLMFGILGPMSTLDTVLRLPLGLQEMVLAVWLIVKGFNPDVRLTSLGSAGAA